MTNKVNAENNELEGSSRKAILKDRKSSINVQQTDTFKSRCMVLGNLIQIFVCLKLTMLIMV